MKQKDWVGNMELELYYSFIAAFSCLEIMIVLNRACATEYQQTVDEGFCNMLRFFMLFCVADMFWGLAASKTVFVSGAMLAVATYIFHIMAGLACFIWFGYILTYMKLDDNQAMVLNAIRYVLVFCQMITIISNLITHKVFTVDSNHNYCPGPVRPVLFILHFSYYIVLIIFATWKWIYVRDEDRPLAKDALLYSIVPFLFGILQLLFVDAPLYSLAFAICAIVIYSFNVTNQRELFLKKQAAKYSSEANMDIMTGLFNRRAYEDEIADYSVVAPEGNFVYLSMDLNGLKNINDDKGHEAGDELLKGAAVCMKDCFGGYGRIFRIGGDEFAGLLYIDKERFKDITVEFEATLLQWRGLQTSSPSVSYGFVYIDETPDQSIYDIAKLADKRMYAAKAAYYQSKGIDRRVHDSVYDAMYDSYNSILAVELGTGKYMVMKSDDIYLKDRVGTSGKLDDLLLRMREGGALSQEDYEKYLMIAEQEIIAQHFRANENEAYCCYYNRTDGEKPVRVLLQVIPAKDYTDANKTVYLYFKNIGEDLRGL